MATSIPQHHKDPVVESMPTDWTTEQKSISKDAMATLRLHYPGWQWSLEWTEIVGDSKLSVLIIRLSDVPTDVVYLVQVADLTKEGAVMRAGGEYLEALGLSRTKGRWDEVHGLKRTPAGLIVPAHAAVPETNPGYAKIKQESTALHG